MEFTIYWFHVESGKKGAKVVKALSPVQMAIYLADWNRQGTYLYSCPALSLSAMGGIARWGEHPEQIKDLGFID